VDVGTPSSIGIVSFSYRVSRKRTTSQCRNWQVNSQRFVARKSIPPQSIAGLFATAIRDGSIEIALTGEAAMIVGEEAVVTAWHKPLARVSRELIPPIEGGHPDARAMRSDIEIKLLAGIAKARAFLDELITGRVLDIADLAQREKRSVHSTAMQLSLAFLAPSLVQAIADNRLLRGIGLTRLADLPSDWSQRFKMLGLQAPR
jgi:site-specific DNA recombinase